MNKIIKSCSILLLLPMIAHAEIIETWECVRPTSDDDSIIVKATVNKGRQSGTIHVAGVKHKTIFTIAGFNRKWVFGALMKDNGYPYTFVIKPDGDAFYYDFTSGKSEVKSSMWLECNQSSE